MSFDYELSYKPRKARTLPVGSSLDLSFGDHTSSKESCDKREKNETCEKTKSALKAISKISKATMNLCTLPRQKKVSTSKYFIFVEARSVHRKDGSLVREEVTSNSQVKVPRRVIEVDKEIMKSGVAVYPGMYY